MSASGTIPRIFADMQGKPANDQPRADQVEPIASAVDEELQTMRICYRALEPLDNEGRNAVLVWLARVLKVE